MVCGPPCRQAAGRATPWRPRARGRALPPPPPPPPPSQGFFLFFFSPPQKINKLKKKKKKKKKRKWRACALLVRPSCSAFGSNRPAQSEFKHCCSHACPQQPCFPLYAAKIALSSLLLSSSLLSSFFNLFFFFCGEKQGRQGEGILVTAGTGRHTQQKKKGGGSELACRLAQPPGSSAHVHRRRGTDRASDPRRAGLPLNRQAMLRPHH